MCAQIANLAPNDGQLEILRRLAPEGAEIMWVDSTQSVEKQAEELKGVVAVIATPSAYPVELANLTPDVKLVQTVSAGTNLIDKLALGELGTCDDCGRRENQRNKNKTQKCRNKG